MSATFLRSAAPTWIEEYLSWQIHDDKERAIYKMAHYIYPRFLFDKTARHHAECLYEVANG